MRRLLMANADQADAAAATSAIEPVAAGAAYTLAVGEGGRLKLEARAAGVDGAFGRVLASAHAAMLDGTWRRLKVCRNSGCGWPTTTGRRTSRARGARWRSAATAERRGRTGAVSVRRLGR
jgi:predicted RNA-binding Zn ribbon-like protein